MLILILGGSASGKSTFAEALAGRLGRAGRGGPAERKIYLATMKPVDEECRERIQKHRKQRQAGQFETREEYGLLQDFSWTDPKATVLFECVSNYLNNLMFAGAEKRSSEELVQTLTDSLLFLSQKSRHLIVVSNVLHEDGIRYDAFTREYLRIFGQINQRLAEAADQVYEVVCGIPVSVKGGENG